MGELDRTYRYRHTLTDRFGGWHHRYIVETEWGAIEFWVTEHGESMKIDDSCGLECHYASTPSHMRGQPPHHVRCDALNGRPCWHDGTSLYASEQLYPMWEADRKTPQDVFSWLILEVRRLKENADE